MDESVLMDMEKNKERKVEIKVQERLRREKVAKETLRRDAEVVRSLEDLEERWRRADQRRPQRHLKKVKREKDREWRSKNFESLIIKASLVLLFIIILILLPLYGNFERRAVMVYYMILGIGLIAFILYIVTKTQKPQKEEVEAVDDTEYPGDSSFLIRIPFY